MNRKNWLSALMAVMMVLSMLTVVSLPAVAATELPSDAVPVTEVTSSTGTSFTVGSLEELIYLASNYTLFNVGDTVYLTTDLDISTYGGDFATDFVSIGKNGDAGGYFKGDLDGMGHTISNYRDTVSFIKGIGGALRNITFKNCSVVTALNEAVVIGVNAVAKGGLVTLDNVKAVGCSLLSEEGVIANNVGIMIGYQNTGTRNLIVRNCAILDCTVDSTGGLATGDGYGTGLFCGRWAAGGICSFENVIIANSSVSAFANASQGGGLLLGDIDPKESGSNCEFTVNNLAFVNVNLKNEAGECAALITTYKNHANADVIGNFSNIYASDVTRTTGTDTAPLTTLEVIKDSGSVTESKTNINVELTGWILGNAMNTLNENPDCEDWGYAPDGSLTLVDIMQDQMAPHFITINFANHRLETPITVYVTAETDVNGNMLLSKAQAQDLKNIPDGGIPGYEGITDWSEVVFETDTVLEAALHKEDRFTWDEATKTHDIRCIDECPDNAEDVPCTRVMTDYHPATYTEGECAEYLCEVCGTAWEDSLEGGAVVSPFALSFDAKEYEAGATVEVRIGVNENTYLNGFIANVSYDKDLLTYESAKVGTNTADTSIEYTCRVTGGDGLLTLTALIPDQVGTVYMDTWVTLTFKANSVVANATPLDVTMDVTSYARIGTDHTFLTDPVLETERTANSYLLPAGGVQLDFTPGDVDGNGTVNVMDVILAEKALAGTAALSDQQKKAANVDGNKFVEAADISMILRRTVDETVYLTPSYAAATIAG